MAKGGFPGFGGNINNLVKQAQKMQRDMERVQEELKEKTVEASAGGGAVTVVATGRKDIKEITINRRLLTLMTLKCFRTLYLQRLTKL